ncbi:endonuclease/exonuclease/phosphatase family protein [Flavobacterium sp. W21_SRS_FM6]|uniref:endonuclease/exonuclease/phosphatase family protein n=1 Tax=Flavobacterium sp. W21_SRS_FM6 TaxID=3240268 RepID=UPI003F906F06
MFKNRYSAVESIKIMGTASKETLSTDFSVLLWNVFKCQKKGWQEDFKTLSKDKDLILLQEAILNSPFDNYFSQSTQYQWMMARSFKNLKTRIETGVKTGSTVPASDYVFSASVPSEPLSQTKKMVLACEYPLPEYGQRLLVVNCHLINFVSFTKFRSHLEQIFQTLERHKGPIVLAGDFNTWNNKRLRFFNHLAKSFLLSEVKMQRKPKLMHLFKHLDHIYCRGITVVQAQVHTDIHSSDHYPISLALRVQASGEP